ncbi:MAG: MoaD/ThiS family protein [Bacteroidota bacterium]|nr:MoaD/ThiS family protein [Bacteroidota bacterium]
MQVLAFGIAKDIFNSSAVEIDENEINNVDQLKLFLEKKYPRLGGLGSYMVALNNEYASGSEQISEGDEVAIIPPVSGG